METLGQLTGGIAHDFNNILGSLLGFIDLSIKKLDENSISFNYLKRAKASGQRAVDLVKQMLAFGRGGDPKPKTILVSDIIEESLNLMRPILPSNIILEFQHDTSEYHVNFDPVQLQQVLMNLCINSRDAFLGKSGKIQIKVQSLTSEYTCVSCGVLVKGDYVSIEVTDNGEGISKENLKKVFEPFFTTKELGKGSGMGLAMVHGIVHRHSGHIHVTSVLKEGTVFKIIIPRAPISNEDMLNLKEAAIKVIHGKLRVLVVDDDVDLNEMMCLMLNEENID
nr:ATP-binding protein [Pseudobdellovibrionaceae bacterium]